MDAKLFCFSDAFKFEAILVCIRVNYVDLSTAFLIIVVIIALVKYIIIDKHNFYFVHSFYFILHPKIEFKFILKL